MADNRTVPSVPSAQSAKDRPQDRPLQKTYIIDTTTTADRTTDAGVLVSGRRTHHMIVDGVVKPYTFEHGKPLEVEYAIAQRFLEIEGFRLADEKGNVQPFVRLPKQPEHLQAGEKLKFADDETIARLSELTTQALQRRAFQMAGGEYFANSNDRAAIAGFIVENRKARQKANLSKESDAPKADEWTPADLNYGSEAVA